MSGQEKLVDEFGLSRVQRISIADEELAEARALACEWRCPDGFPSKEMQNKYLVSLTSAAALYSFDGLQLLSRRVRKLAREGEVPKAWVWFDNINRRPS